MRRASGRLTILAIVSVAFAGCFYSVKRSGSGYSRSGVWLPKSVLRPGGAPRPAPKKPLASEGLPLVWQPELAAYRIEGRPCVFYRLALFYRLNEIGWEQAETMEGPWVRVFHEDLPESLVSGLEATGSAFCSHPP